MKLMLEYIEYIVCFQHWSQLHDKNIEITGYELDYWSYNLVDLDRRSGESNNVNRSNSQEIILLVWFSLCVMYYRNCRVYLF